MTTINLRNPTGRKTPAHIVTIGDREYFFSYETLIAYRGRTPLGGYAKCRVANHWGPTTGRHFKELGCAEFEIVSDEALRSVAAF